MKAKNTEVALANPNVNNTINMSLNQNDMIDVVIEHQLELITAELEEVTKAIDVNHTAIKALEAATREELIKRFIKTTPELTNFNKIVKQYKLNVSDRSSVGADQYSKEAIGIAECDDLDLDRLEGYKDPYNYARRNPAKITLKIVPFTNVNVNYRAELNGLVVGFTSEKEKLTLADQKEYIQKMTVLLKAKEKLQNQEGALIMSYLEYKYGEKRIKAKIVKASLRKSDEGRGILKMLEGATNIKLLG